MYRMLAATFATSTKTATPTSNATRPTVMGTPPRPNDPAEQPGPPEWAVNSREATRRAGSATADDSARLLPTKERPVEREGFRIAAQQGHELEPLERLMV